MTNVFFAVALLCEVSTGSTCSIQTAQTLYPDKNSCEIDFMFNGIPYFSQTLPEHYIAGFACVEATLMDEAV